MDSYGSLRRESVHLIPQQQQSELLKQRESLTEKLLNNLSKNFDKKNSKILDYFDVRKKILNMKEKGKVEAGSIFHFKQTQHLRVMPDYKINIPKLCLHFFFNKCANKLVDMNFEELLAFCKSKERGGKGESKNLNEVKKIKPHFI